MDEAILLNTAKGIQPPTLRLYAWDPPCISLGYAQALAEVDMALLQAKGWEVVRRPTGGRAILHTDELTYSVIGPENEPRLSGDILSSYKRLSQALMLALQLIGLPVKALPKEEAPQGMQTDPVCFDVPSNYEITVEGKKLVGSAQARRKEGVLQHGTLPLSGDLTRITQALVYPDEESRSQAAQKLLARAATVEMALGQTVSWEQAADAFSQAFEQQLNLTLEKGELTPEELEKAEELLKEKYDHPDWTGKK